MTSLLSAKKRAEEFAAVVDGGADETTLRPELAELMGVVGTLQREAQAGTHLAPRPAFTSDLRERLMAEAATSLAQDTILTLPARKKGSRERRIALVASSIVLVGGSAGLAAAAQNALPGEALYPIKRGLEKAQTELATSRAGQGQDLLAQADNRLVEVRELVEGSDNLNQVPATIDDFTSQALEASDVLLKEFETSREASLIEELRTFAALNLAELQELSKNAAPEHQDELAAAAEALMAIDESAQAVCPTCASDLRALKMPALFLTANEARDAIDAAGRVVVDNSHPVMPDEFKTPGGDKKGPSPDDKDGDQPTPDDTSGGTDIEGTDETDGGSDAPKLPGSDVDTNAPDGTDLLGELDDALSGKDGTGDKSTGDGGKTGKDGKTGGDSKLKLDEIVEDVTGSILP